VVDVGRTLWQYCHTLRHDGMDYGEYLDQLTYLLFLKMADERSLELPLEARWAQLVSVPDAHLLASYHRTLQRLKDSNGLVGDIFSASVRLQPRGVTPSRDTAD
jgi:type I restriction enzyme M protein